MSTVSVRIAIAESYLCNLLLFSKIKKFPFYTVCYLMADAGRGAGAGEAVAGYWSEICMGMRGNTDVHKSGL